MIISVLQNVYFNMDKHISRSDGVKSNGQTYSARTNKWVLFEAGTMVMDTYHKNKK